jgi:hypothetical protein
MTEELKSLTTQICACPWPRHPSKEHLDHNKAARSRPPRKTTGAEAPRRMAGAAVMRRTAGAAVPRWMVGALVMRRTVVAAVEEKVRFKVTEYIYMKNMENSWKMAGYVKFLLGKVAGSRFWWDYSSRADGGHGKIRYQ